PYLTSTSPYYLHPSFFSYSPPPRHLHSFPTRRSSDLVAGTPYGQVYIGTYKITHDGAGHLSSVFTPTVGVDQPATSSTINAGGTDRKSTRLNSSHLGISYAVFCLKKKK